MNEEKPIEQQVTRGLNTPPVQPTKKTFPFPTEIISLPSKGLVYPEGSPLANGEITIKLMTAKEEDILTSTALIKKGIQLDKLFESLIVEPGVNPNDIVTGDKNAILISSRILAFGPEYGVTINDPEENEPVDVTVDLSKIKVKEVNESLLNRNNEFDFVFVPMLAFDMNGYRVGYGKGFYDRFLKYCKDSCVFIGLNIFDKQIKIDDIEESDIPLDFCVTPKKIIKFTN